MGSIENKMSDGGRGRASLATEVWKSSQMWNVRRSGVRSIAWLDGFIGASQLASNRKSKALTRF